jgi:hypothetical protein
MAFGGLVCPTVWIVGCNGVHPIASHIYRQLLSYSHITWLAPQFVVCRGEYWFYDCYWPLYDARLSLRFVTTHGRTAMALEVILSITTQLIFWI